MKILSRLPISNYWTTNYDSIIEDTLYNLGKIPDVKITSGQMKYTKPEREAVVYKMLGDKSESSKVVVTRDDYENYQKKCVIFTTCLKGKLVAKTFLFIGFSFDDPNLEEILRRVRVELIKDEETPKIHYCFMKKVYYEDYKSKIGN